MPYHLPNLQLISKSSTNLPIIFESSTMNSASKVSPVSFTGTFTTSAAPRLGEFSTSQVPTQEAKHYFAIVRRHANGWYGDTDAMVYPEDPLQKPRSTPRIRPFSQRK